jgi:hypothetical protein
VPKPIAICIEDLRAGSDSTRYLQCVALVGDHPGLRIDPGGEIQWQPERDARLVELCVSYDERLILFRQPGAAPVLLRREGRSLEVPVGKPVVVLDQDQLTVESRELRIHVHGEAPAVAPPSWLEMVEAPSRSRSSLLRATATALALGIAVGAGGCTKKIEVRDDPPKVAPPPTKPDSKPPPKPDSSLPPKADAGPSKADAAKKAPPIEVRPRPPRVAPPRKPPPKPDKPE